MARDSGENRGREGRHVVVIGAGPAGLTAAHEVCRSGVPVTVLEQSAIVGGLAKTESYKGFRFDMGGHRFFSKSPEVNRFWQDVLGGEFLRRNRQSRIFYRGKFFNYPLKPFNALAGLGLVESVLILISYLRWRLFPYRHEETFEQWVTNRFGRRLFRTFFQSYTEKVWGISCSELKAEWAAQRIKNLSLRTAILGMFFKPRVTVRSLIEQFDYPRLGPGQMWEAVRDHVESVGGQVHTHRPVQKILRTGNRIDAVQVAGDSFRISVRGTDFLSSMPLPEFVRKLDPPAPDHVLNAARQLKHRDFLTVCLIVNRDHLFSDNWIYVHDPEVNVGRIQNFKNWSPDMVPDPAKTSLGLEYFCNEGDALWTMSDDELIELGVRELEKLGLAHPIDVEDGCVFRVPKSYPVYDADYREHLATLRGFVESLENVQMIGRNGLHRYNNQDHAMLTGMFAVRNLLNGEAHDLWNVNVDQEYHEEIRAGGAAQPSPDTESPRWPHAAEKTAPAA